MPLGSLVECWCGLPLDHDWPGKAEGRKHPTGANTTMQTLDRGDLKAYHQTVQEFILHEIRINGLKFRIKNNAILLYPPDGTPPMSVYARNTDRQLKNLGTWHQKHVQPYLAQEQQAADVEAAAKVLADAINDPVEHPRREEPVKPDQASAEETVQRDTHGWAQYIGTEGDAIEGILTNGERYKCVLCEGTDHPLDTTNPRSIGGHRRIWHTTGPTLWENRTKAAESLRQTNQEKRAQTEKSGEQQPKHRFTHEEYQAAGAARTRNAQKVKAARRSLEQMCAALDYYPQDPSAPKVTEVDQMRAGMVIESMAERDEWKKKAEDAEAKLAILREAMGL